MPFIGRLQFTVPPQAGKRPVITMSIGLPDRTAIGRNLTPVMARLDPKDLEALDTLITAGIVANRAEGVRWVSRKVPCARCRRRRPVRRRKDLRSAGIRRGRRGRLPA